MLVLTRKTDEQILIGDDIKITLVRIRGGNVRIGIEAPRDIRIKRAELENLPSAEPTPSTTSKSRVSGTSRLAETRISQIQSAKSQSLKSQPSASPTIEAEEPETDPYSEVFAHPQLPRTRNEQLARAASRQARLAQASLAAADDSAVIGNVTRHSDQNTSHRAPLSGFVAAS